MSRNCFILILVCHCFTTNPKPGEPIHDDLLGKIQGFYQTCLTVSMAVCVVHRIAFSGQISGFMERMTGFQSLYQML
jgi:hypothetical protein